MAAMAGLAGISGSKVQAACRPGRSHIGEAHAVNSQTNAVIGLNAPAGSRSRAGDPRFYIAAAVAAALLVFAGFERTYYLRGLFGAPALPWLLHLHGAVMTSWFVLFFTQTCLIAAHRVTWHRWLGICGVVLAGLVVIVDAQTLLHAAARGVHDPAESFFIAILCIGLVTLAVFALLLGTAIALRRRSDYHKRLMLLATLSLLGAGLSRLPLDFIQSDFLTVSTLLTDLCVLAAVVIDSIRNQRLHPAFAWGTLLIVASTWLALIGGQTRPWVEFATWLVT